MVNIRLKHYNSSDTLTATYVVEGFLVLRDRLSQLTPALALPFSKPNKNILLNITGQNEVYTGNFLILPRSDDYTQGTGTAVSGLAGMESQIEFLKENIFKTSGTHGIHDENNKLILGRITDFEITKQGDDPVQHSVSFTFNTGLVLI